MFEDLFNFVTTIITDNIGSMVVLFADVITPLIGSCVTLYAIYLAFQALYDAENMMIMESLKFIGSLALCTTVAFNTSWYMSSIVPMVLHSGDTVASYLTSSTGGSGSALQEMFETMLVQIESLWDNVSFGVTASWGDSFLMVILLVLVILGYVPFILVATAYLLIAKIMVGFLLTLGPLFIMFAFFPSTRSMFQSWTGQCLNYVLLTIVYPLAFNIFNLTINYVVGGNEEISFASCLMTLILFGCCILISVQIPVFCSSLSGGVGINGLVSNMGMGMRSLSNATKGGAGAAKRAGQSTYSGAKSLGDKFKNRIRPG
ncbi:type IV secretion system protein [Vibrio parahaemolyticus]|uniref:type IV secretion system protein n=1 Tax=Vibrio parahaemolyticus TaxID=670 RepID=UPI00186976A3|nr:type IV secretion system protein [Vibrio parahaemolyticus]HDM8234325.1 type IV secretion system protein [Vibrio campbellii]MBE4171686.1 type IV secretion system protein [Vibrio parahaemolyticus]MCI9700466.1 type IV secretion system protein [Vibrio parahaemolyticus]MCR9709975.1 type IV secretion system protein [Vibrio parahaemolyticus]MCR9756610.1 type IV secretion system protein [Vibrio parahaemolyticus]